MRIKPAKKLFVALLVVFGILGMAPVYAVTQGASNVQSGTPETYTPTPGSVSAQGGNITSLTIDATVQTKKWQGFYGNISGTITLANSTGNAYMYNWSVSPGTGVVILTQDGAFPWDKLTNGSDSTVDTAWGFTGDDKAEDTFADVAACSPVTVNGNSIGNNDNEVYLWDNTGNGYFCEYLGEDSGGTGAKEDFAFIAKIYNDATCFNGDTCDFELIVPVEPTGTSSETYYVYVEF